MCGSLRDDGVSYSDYLEQLTSVHPWRNTTAYPKPDEADCRSRHLCFDVGENLEIEPHID